jgi:hypothetical protein
MVGMVGMVGIGNVTCHGGSFSVRLGDKKSVTLAVKAEISAQA